MNVLLWIAQIGLAVVSFAGGAWKLFMFDEIARMPAMTVLSRGEWGAVGVFEMVCAALLILPLRRLPLLLPGAAAALAIESLVLAGIYGRVSLHLTLASPLVWAVAIGVIAAFVAVGRYPHRTTA